KCPEEAISFFQPNPQLLQQDADKATTSPAILRRELSTLIGELAVSLSEASINVPSEITSLLIPTWDESRCIGCRECQIDVCPYDVVTNPIRMPLMKETSSNRTFLRMHPKTARDLNLTDGCRVTIESKRGSIENIRLELTEDVDPRVVWSSDGWWNHDGNVNVLTDDKHTAFGHTPGFNSVLVRVVPFRK
ncbi:MAG: hypothetical protein OEV85_10365, partial [Candidatus Thorarchaeota archaeon]|nr:hypothetical protein [Candidatus Thorarchaeota archaeon]